LLRGLHQGEKSQLNAYPANCHEKTVTTSDFAEVCIRRRIVLWRKIIGWLEGLGKRRVVNKGLKLIRNSSVGHGLGSGAADAAGDGSKFGNAYGHTP
jgi:hypothetical protein